MVLSKVDAPMGQCFGGDEVVDLTESPQEVLKVIDRAFTNTFKKLSLWFTDDLLLHIQYYLHAATW